MDERFVRTALIFGEDGMRRLSDARVAVFGVGGVGGHLVQALARAGVGHITVIDDDVVSVSNINRQAVAMDSTVGRPKVEVIAEQVRDINPACEVTPLRLFYTPENAETLDLARFDAIADCIDTVKAKVTLICRAKATCSLLLWFVALTKRSEYSSVFMHWVSSDSHSMKVSFAAVTAMILYAE